MDKKIQSVLNLSALIKSQSLVLLDKLNELDIDELADEVDALSDHAEGVKRYLQLGLRGAR
ncbi:Rop family plasmid primer RNA-binding protein [Vibrio navarrensis]